MITTAQQTIGNRIKSFKVREIGIGVPHLISVVYFLMQSYAFFLGVKLFL